MVYNLLLMNLAESIKKKTIELGFDLVGITDTSPLTAEQTKLFTDWLNAGYAGQMTYLQRNLEKRINPAMHLKDAKSIICVGLNYALPIQRKANISAPTGSIAAFAQYEDYHLFIKKKLRELTVFIASQSGSDLKFKICVDSAPIAEKALAERAGLGFIGKNHLLINPKLGLQILLGEIITNLELDFDKPITTNCSDCNKCIHACPTGALDANGQFDANKCISYLTIEYKGRIPTELAEKIGDQLFGCDECMLACPYQQNMSPCKNELFKFHSDRSKLGLHEILDLNQHTFETGFYDSCIKRLGLERLKRNAEICLANIASRKS